MISRLVALSGNPNTITRLLALISKPNPLKDNDLLILLLLGIEFKFNEKLMGGPALDATWVPLPEETLTAAKQSDDVLLGVIGGFVHNLE